MKKKSLKSLELRTSGILRTSDILRTSGILRTSAISRTSKKPVHFRDEIRTSFISYAFVPVAALMVLITLCAGIIWSVGIIRKAKNDCETICVVVNEAVENYLTKVEELSGLDIPRMRTDKNLVSETYSALKEFSRKQLIAANFVVLDDDYSILLQGDSSQTFHIPLYQKEIDWGPLQRMSQNSGKTVLEISHEYSAGALDEIIIGAAVRSGGFFGEPVESSSVRSGQADISDGEKTGYLICTITGKSVQDALKSISSPYVITNSFRDVFVTTNRYYLDDMNRLSSVYRTESDEVSITGSDAVYRADICDGALSVYTIIDVSQMKKALKTLVLLAVILLVFLSAAMFISGGKIAADKTRTIDELVAAFHDVEEGNLENRIDIRENIEFQTIGEAYNKMLDDIKRLIAENEKETKAKYISELKQLEMQFNPHFLYNTLATVRYLVKLDPDGAVRTVVSLAELLRYSLNSKNSYVELGEDLKYIENYLTILETRFGSKFSFEINVSDECKNAVIPKLIVQPVIENAVKYGFEGVASMKISVRAEKWDLQKKRGGLGFEHSEPELPLVSEPHSDGGSVFMNGEPLSINADGAVFVGDGRFGGAQFADASASSGENKLLLTITDTGSGMDSETLTQVKSLLSTPENATNHIGLFNVQRRIKLLYGEAYGLTVESEAGRGTVVRISLPYKCGNVSV